MSESATVGNEYQDLINYIDEKIQYEFNSLGIMCLILVDVSMISSRFVEIVDIFETELLRKIDLRKTSPTNSNFISNNFNSMKEYFKNCMEDIDQSKYKFANFFQKRMSRRRS